MDATPSRRPVSSALSGVEAQRLTHWVVAREPSLQRLVSSFAVPFRPIGPLTDYYGPVAPYLVELRSGMT